MPQEIKPAHIQRIPQIHGIKIEDMQLTNFRLLKHKAYAISEII
jgi:hypothetical protein